MVEEISQAIVAQARSWTGTRFRHQGRRRRNADNAGGVDCLGVIIGVASELSLTDRRGQLLAGHDRISYSKSPDGKQLYDTLSSLMFRIDAESARAGDIGLFMLDGNPQHLAIFSEYGADGELGMIHAYAPLHQVVEHRFDMGWRMKMVAAFRLPRGQQALD